ncbi:alpha/beta fold hydrolase [Maricaulis sp.]|uniref:alpha/beta fold hydrolase n=1 Tax=Maricaulis sp. TaxID=1486257 RepID=UPI001B282A8B|nr:alpha/beta hydrolase [Maricaulis sp.]MBO6765835.1 alpha/beta hydrolase [Maricaulis sp.]
MFKFKPVPPAIGALIAAATALTAVMAAEASGQETLQVERAGTAGARTVILVPGLATPGEVWDGTAGHFENTADLYVVTLAGFGGAAPAERSAGVIETAVADLTALIDREGLTDAVVVGHSMGGQIALQLAAARPDAVSDVVVVDSAPFFARLFNPAITADQAAAFGQATAAQMAAMDRDTYLAQSRMGLPIQSISDEGQAQVLAWMEASDQATVATAFGEVAGSDFSPVLAGVTADVTVLVAWAPGAPVGAEALAGVYSSQYAGLESVEVGVIEGSRHFIMIDQPDAFAERLAAVIANGEGE